MTAFPGKLLHQAPMAGPLHSGFPLRHSRRLPLVAWHFPLSWSRFAKDKVVLGSISCQSGLSLLVLGHIFLLGMGHGLDMKWAEVTNSFGPTIAPKNPAVRLLGRGGGFWCSRAYVMTGRVLSPLLAPGPLRLPKARFWRFGVRGALSLILLWDDADRFGIWGTHSMVPL